MYTKPENAATVRAQRGRRCQACLIDLRNCKKGIAAEASEELLQVSERKFPNRYPAENTPALFINGRRLVGAAPLKNFVRVIDDELARK
jgi:hypothetical protein